LPRLFDPVIELARQFAIEKDHQLAGREAVFRAAKTKDIHATLPADFLWLAG